MKNNKLLLILLTTILVFFIPQLLAGKDKDDGDDGDDNGDNGGKKNLTITGAEPDFDNDTILITGDYFSKKNTFKGQVLLYFPPETGSISLNVLNFDPTSPQMILADLPDGIEEYPGTYLLLVTQDNKKNSPNKGDGFDVTIGAVGAEGPIGPTGLVGATGPNRSDGTSRFNGSTGTDRCTRCDGTSRSYRIHWSPRLSGNSGGTRYRWC